MPQQIPWTGWRQYFPCKASFSHLVTPLVHLPKLKNTRRSVLSKQHKKNVCLLRSKNLCITTRTRRIPGNICQFIKWQRVDKMTLWISINAGYSLTANRPQKFHWAVGSWINDTPSAAGYNWGWKIHRCGGDANQGEPAIWSKNYANASVNRIPWQSGEIHHHWGKTGAWAAPVSVLAMEILPGTVKADSAITMTNTRTNPYWRPSIFILNFAQQPVFFFNDLKMQLHQPAKHLVDSNDALHISLKTLPDAYGIWCVLLWRPLNHMLFLITSSVGIAQAREFVTCHRHRWWNLLDGKHQDVASILKAIHTHFRQAQLDLAWGFFLESAPVTRSITNNFHRSHWDAVGCTCHLFAANFKLPFSSSQVLLTTFSVPAFFGTK